MGKNKGNTAAGKGGSALTTATLALVLMTWLALAAGLALLHQQQRQQARQQARHQAATLAGQLAHELAGRASRDARQLALLTGDAISGTTIQSGPWLADARLIRVPDGADEADNLSFTQRDLLQQLRQSGQDSHALRGGDHPALLLAHAVTGGSLILEDDLSPWLGDARRRLPAGGGLSLAQGSLTLARQGRIGQGLPEARDESGGVTVTVAIPPRPATLTALLPTAALSGLLLVIAIAVGAWLLARALRGDAARLAGDIERAARHRAPADQPLALPALGAVREALAGLRAQAAPPTPAPETPGPTAAPPAPTREEPAPPSEPPAGATPSLPDGIFRAYDIRGVAGEELSVEVVTLLGRAIGTLAGEANQQTVFVARDGRLSGPELMEALIDGLKSSGRHVVNLGMQPTPLLYYATETLESRSGVCLTGSHNPPEYNGLKIVIDGTTLHGERIEALRDRILQGHLAQGEGSVEERDIGERYLRAVSDDIVLARPLNIAVDCGNGVTGTLGPRLFEELGCKVVPLYTEVDGHFPNHHPNPSDPANLKALIDTVREQKLDLGLAFDGDGDRLGLVNARGEIIWADRLMMLFARDLLHRNPGADVIFDVKCSRALPDLIRKQGGRPVMYKTGHSLIKALMKEMGASLAGEMSGHIFFADRWFGFDDGLYAGARLLEILSLEQGDSATVFDGLRTGESTPELTVEVGDERKFDIVAALRDRADRFTGGRANTVDGLRVDFPDGWGLVRASNTTPVLVCRFEGRDRAALERITGLFRDQLRAVDDSLTLPF